MNIHFGPLYINIKHTIFKCNIKKYMKETWMNKKAMEGKKGSKSSVYMKIPTSFLVFHNE